MATNDEPCIVLL
jgi:hypothetical protein